MELRPTPTMDCERSEGSSNEGRSPPVATALAPVASLRYCPLARCVLLPPSTSVCSPPLTPSRPLPFALTAPPLKLGQAPSIELK